MTTRGEEHLRCLTSSATADALAGRGFDWSPLDAHACTALRYRRTRPDAPAVVGLVGGASSGKSTLFNSVLGREISCISAHAHETLGPILAAEANVLDTVNAGIREGLLFAGLRPTEQAAQAPTTGDAGEIVLYPDGDGRLHDVVIVDLPDVTSKMSADEGAVARNLLPYFDGLVVVVDEERWFDAAVFEETVEWSRNFGPRVWIVFNRTEDGPALTTEQRDRLERHARAHHAADSWVSPFQPGFGYRPVSAETLDRLLDWASTADGASRPPVLEQYVQRRATDVVRENLGRGETFDRMRRAVEDQLAEVVADTRLSFDLLTSQERGLLGLGHRYLPLYEVFRNLKQRVGWLAGRRDTQEVDFEKRGEQLAEVLTRNLELRFRHATDRIDEITMDSGYFESDASGWRNNWVLPDFDAAEWAHRIRTHIDAWKAETTKQTRRGDVAALSVGMPLLLADLLFLGGAGTTLTWTAASVAAFLGGKGIAQLVQRSTAYANYQTTVRAYQSFIREALAEQWQKNLAAMPSRHFKMTDPILEALMYWSAPGER